ELLIEEKRAAEEKRKELEKVAELKVREDKRAADAVEDAEEEREQNAAYVKLVEENRKEQEKATKELERRQRRAPAAKTRAVDVVVLPQPSGSRSKVFKSKSVISDDSDVMDVDKEQVETPRGVKRKRPIKMIAKKKTVKKKKKKEKSLPPPNVVQRARDAFYLRQRCSWIEDHASRRSRGKRARVEDEMYRGPAARVGERRRVEGNDIAEQLARIAEQNQDLVKLLRQSLVVQEKMLGIMVRAENRVIEAMGESEKDDDEEEDEDGEGEEDEEEKERDDEEKKRKEVREGKRRAD
ncbi:hypothetical protein F5890DRAFT_1560182, partial [Lentinula detonsa]